MARILEQDGLEAANTNRIAEVAGVSIGSLYQYFDTKESILEELARRERMALLERLLQIEAAQETWAVSRLALITAAVDHQLARPRLARALEYAEAMMGQPQSVAGFDAEVIACITRIVDQSGLELETPDKAAQDLVAMVRGMADAAGLRGEKDHGHLATRIESAVKGYLAEWACLTGKINQ